MPDNTIVRRSVCRPSPASMTRPDGVRKRGRPRVSWGQMARTRALNAAGGSETRLAALQFKRPGSHVQWHAVVRRHCRLLMLRPGVPPRHVFVILLLLLLLLLHRGRSRAASDRFACSALLPMPRQGAAFDSNKFPSSSQTCVVPRRMKSPWRGPISTWSRSSR